MAFEDLFVVGATIFGLALVALIGWSILNTLGTNTDYINHTYSDPTGLTTTTINPWQSGVNAFSALDWGVLLIVTGLTIGMIFLGFALPSHPIYAFVGVIIMILWLLVSPALSNVYYNAVMNTMLGDVITHLPLTWTLMQNLPLFGLVLGAVASIFTYGKRTQVRGL